MCLAVGHNLFWEAPDTDLPIWFLRAAMTVSSLFTGVAVGTVCGVVAWGLRRATG